MGLSTAKQDSRLSYEITQGHLLFKKNKLSEDVVTGKTTWQIHSAPSWADQDSIYCCYILARYFETTKNKCFKNIWEST